MKETTMTEQTMTEAPDAIGTLRAAEAEYAAVASEIARLRTVLSGSVSEAVTRRISRQVFDKDGRVQVAGGDVVELMSRQTTATERVAARQALPGLEIRLLDAEVAVEQARTAAAEAAGVARDAALAEGLALVRKDLPGLLRTQRQLQARWQAFAAQCERIDQHLGATRFFVMAPGAQFDLFVAHCRESFEIE
jgi:hypothetical protein